MSSEDSKISEVCPLCGGEFKFLHVNFEEDVKMCTNDECLYPFVPEVDDVFVPGKTKIEEGFCPSDEYVEALKSKVEKELQERGFDWKTFDRNKFVSNLDEGACELDDDSLDDDSLDELTLEKEVDVGTNSLNLDEFLDSLCAAPKTSALATVYEDPSVTKMIQSCIDSCEAEVNRHAAYETSIKSVMSELEETLGKMNVDSQIDVQWDADDFNTETFEMNKSGEGPDGLETAAAVEQVSLQSSYDPTITTSNDASENRTMDCVKATKDTPSSSTSTTATIEGTCAQTSEKSNDNVKGYMEQLNHLFAKTSFAKFHFPEFGKSDQNTLKQMPRMYSEYLKNRNKRDPEIYTADYNLPKQMPRRHSEHLKNKNKLDPEFNNADHNLSKQMRKMCSERVKNKNKFDPEFHNANQNLSKQMSRRHSECVKNKNNMDPESYNTDRNKSQQMPKRHSERLKNKNKIVVSSLEKMPQ